MRRIWVWIKAIFGFRDHEVLKREQLRQWLVLQERKRLTEAMKEL